MEATAVSCPWKQQKKTKKETREASVSRAAAEEICTNAAPVAVLSELGGMSSLKSTTNSTVSFFFSGENLIHFTGFDMS